MPNQVWHDSITNNGEDMTNILDDLYKIICSRKKAEGKPELISESADLLFHLLVLWAECGVEPKEIMAELERRKEKGKNPDKPQPI